MINIFQPLHVFDPLANESHFFDIVGNESLNSIGDLSLLFCRILNISPDDHFIFMTTTGLVAENDSCLTKYRTSVDYNQVSRLCLLFMNLLFHVLLVSRSARPKVPSGSSAISWAVIVSLHPLHKSLMKVLAKYK